MTQAIGAGQRRVAMAAWGMTIRTGIGGWIYEPWRGGTFYPEGHRQADELHFASRAVGAIEINATFYRLQKPESFRKWRDTAPEGFSFALKGSRFVSNRRDLREAGEGVARFAEQGIAELGDMLGPVLWQLAATKAFDAEEIAAFFALLPREAGGLPLRHAIEVGHESFDCPEFLDLARGANVAVVYLEQEGRPCIAERTADFAYLRCKNLKAQEPTGYSPGDIARIADLCRDWGEQGDVFAFLINGAKERAPAAAMALADQIGGDA